MKDREDIDRLYGRIIELLVSDDAPDDPSVALTALTCALVEVARASNVAPVTLIRNVTRMCGGSFEEIGTGDKDKSAS